MLSIQINPAQLELARRLMSPDQLNRAIKSAVTATAKSMRTQIRREVQEEIKVKVSDFNQVVRIGHTASSGGQHSATVRVSHKPLPLSDFRGVRWSKRGGVTANLWKKRPAQKMPWGFQATMRSGHTGFFARANGGKSRKIRAIHGPSIHGEVAKAQVNHRIVAAAQKVFEARFLSQFKRFGIDTGPLALGAVVGDN